MGYRSQVVAVVGGTAEEISKFSQQVLQADMPDEYKIRNDFKLFSDSSTNLVYFAFIQNYYKWYPEPEKTWEIIREMAEKAELSWVFCRIGEELDDIENDNNSGEDYFKEEMLILFTFDRQIISDSKVFEEIL